MHVGGFLGQKKGNYWPKAYCPEDPLPDSTEEMSAVRSISEKDDDKKIELNFDRNIYDDLSDHLFDDLFSSQKGKVSLFFLKLRGLCCLVSRF